MKLYLFTQESLTRHFEWDYADRMRVFRNQISTSEPTVYSQYFYDAGGNRVMKFTRKQGGNWQWTVYIDGIFEWTQNSDAEQQSIAHIIDDKSRIASVRNGDAMDDNTPDIKYNLEDHLGSSMTLLDENGGWVNWEEYYPFGETSLGSYAKKRYRFCGKERDEESGLYYYGARYYLPWLCRFASVDPLAGDYPFYTPYQYAGNKPINFIDLDGLEEAKPQTGSGGGVIIETGGGSALIDSGAKILDNGVGVVSQDGTKFLNIDGIGLVQESLLINNDVKATNPSLAKNNNTGYIYTSDDLKMRSNILKLGIEDNVVARALSIDENNGKFQPLTRKGFIKKYGDASGLVVWSLYFGMAFETLPGAEFKLPSIKGFNLKPRLSSKVTEGAQNIDDFISPHAYSRHKFDSSRTSSKSRTQYGQGIDVADIRKQTINNADEIVPHFNNDGVHYATTYKKTFSGQNISTSATPTSESRVIINHLDSNKSTQFPFYKK